MPLHPSDSKTAIRTLRKTATRYLSRGFIFFAGLYWVLHFDRSQSIGLALGFMLAIDLASAPASESDQSFHPHRFSFKFHTYPILKDLGLIASEEAYQRIVDGPLDLTLPWQPKLIHAYPINAYVLSEKPPIVHYPELNYYTSRLQFRQGIEEGSVALTRN